MIGYHIVITWIRKAYECVPTAIRRALSPPDTIGQTEDAMYSTHRWPPKRRALQSPHRGAQSWYNARDETPQFCVALYL